MSDLIDQRTEEERAAQRSILIQDALAVGDDAPLQQRLGARAVLVKDISQRLGVERATVRDLFGDEYSEDARELPRLRSFYESKDLRALWSDKRKAAEDAAAKGIDALYDVAVGDKSWLGQAAEWTAQGVGAVSDAGFQAPMTDDLVDALDAAKDQRLTDDVRKSVREANARLRDYRSKLEVPVERARIAGGPQGFQNVMQSIRAAESAASLPARYEGQDADEALVREWSGIARKAATGQKYLSEQRRTQPALSGAAILPHLKDQRSADILAKGFGGKGVAGSLDLWWSDEDKRTWMQLPKEDRDLLAPVLAAQAKAKDEWAVVDFGRAMWHMTMVQASNLNHFCERVITQAVNDSDAFKNLESAWTSVAGNPVVAFNPYEELMRGRAPNEADMGPIFRNIQKWEEEWGSLQDVRDAAFKTGDNHYLVTDWFIEAGRQIPYMVQAAVPGLIAASTATDIIRARASQGLPVSSTADLVDAFVAGVAVECLEHLQVKGILGAGGGVRSIKDRIELYRFLRPLVMAKTFGKELGHELGEEVSQDLVQTWAENRGVDRDTAAEWARTVFDTIEQGYGSFGVMVAVGMAKNVYQGRRGMLTGKDLKDSLDSAGRYVAEMTGANGPAPLPTADRMEAWSAHLGELARGYFAQGGSAKGYAWLEGLGYSKEMSQQMGSLFRSVFKAIGGNANLTQEQREESLRAFFGGRSFRGTEAILRDMYPGASFDVDKETGKLHIRREINGKTTDTTLEIGEIAMATVQEVRADPQLQTSLAEELGIPVEKLLAMSDEAMEQAIAGLTPEGFFQLTDEKGNVVDSVALGALSGRIKLAPGVVGGFNHEQFHAFVSYLRVSNQLSEEDVKRLRERFGDARPGVDELFNEEAAANFYRDQFALPVPFAEEGPMEKVFRRAGELADRGLELLHLKKARETAEEALVNDVATGNFRGVQILRPTPPKQAGKPRVGAHEPPEPENAAGTEATEQAEESEKAGEATEAPAETAGSSSAWSAVTPDGSMKLAGTWAVIDAGNLLASSDEGYDQAIQPRDRTSMASDAQVHSIARQLDATRLMDSPTTDTGAPLVSADGMVLSGNGRTLAIREAYKIGTAGDYAASVRAKARELGIAVPDSMRAPVLVRLLDASTSQENLVRAAELSNRPQILSRNEAETAEADAATVLQGGMLDLLQPGENGELLGEANRAFMDAFINATGDQGMRTADGFPTAEAQKRVRRAVLAALFQDLPNKRDLIRSAVEDGEELHVTRELAGLMRGAPAILQAASERPAYDLRQEIGLALADYLDFKRQGGGDVDAFLSQGRLFDPRPPEVEAIVRELGRRQNGAEIADFLGEYARRARLQAAEGQGMLFEDVAPPSKLDLIRRAAEVTRPETGVPAGARWSIGPNIDSLLSRFDEAKGKSREEIFKTFDNTQKIVGTIPGDLQLPPEVDVAQRVVKCAEAFLLDHLLNKPGHEKALSAEDAKRILGLVDPANEMRLVKQRGSSSIAFIAPSPGGGWDCIVIAPRRGEFYVFKTMFAQTNKPYQDKALIRYRPQTAGRNKAADSLLRGPLASIRDGGQATSGSLSQNGSGVKRNSFASTIGGRNVFGMEGQSEAARMATAGASREDIWRKTGWWKGKDGKWRVEIPDLSLKDHVVEAVRDVLDRQAGFSFDNLPTGEEAEGNFGFNVLVADAFILRAERRLWEAAVRDNAESWRRDLLTVESAPLESEEFRAGVARMMPLAREVVDGEALEYAIKENGNYNFKKIATDLLRFMGLQVRDPSGGLIERDMEQERNRIDGGFRFAAETVVDLGTLAWTDNAPLFRAYSFLRGVPVEFRKLSGAYAEADPTPGSYRITVDADRFRKDPSTLLSSLAHEVQHLIQAQEGLAKGGDIRSAHNAFLDRKNRELESISAAKDRAMDELRLMSIPADASAEDREAFDRAREEKGREIMRLVARYDEIMREKTQRDPFESYRRLAGETEARAVQARLAMTSEQRGSTPPWESYDVDETDQVIRYSFAPHGVQKRAGVEYPDAGEEIKRFSIGKKRMDEYRDLLARKRPDLDAEKVLAELDKLGDPKKEKVALHWVVRGSLLLPQDAYKIDDALDVAAKAKVDPFAYKSPDELLLANKQFKPSARPIDPATVPELSDPQPYYHINDYDEAEDTNIVTYAVEDTRAGQEAMRRIIDTHWGEDANPWCLLARTGAKETPTEAFHEWLDRKFPGRPMTGEEVRQYAAEFEESGGVAYDKQQATLGSDAWDYWNHYSALPKRVAFKNGKLLAFMATHGLDLEDDWQAENDLQGRFPDLYAEYSEWLDTDEGQEEQASFTEWLEHNHEYALEDAKENPDEEWWDRGDNSHPSLDWALTEEGARNGGIERWSFSPNDNLRQDIEAALSKRTPDDPTATPMKRHADIVFSNDYPFFEFLGLPNLPVVTEVIKIRKMKNRHHLSEDQIAELPEHYSRPVAVALDGENGFIVLTDLIGKGDDGADKPVMVYLRKRTNKSGEVNFIATAFAFDRESEGKYYIPHFKAGLLFVDENKLAGLGLEEGTESTLRTLAAGEHVLTASDYSWWSTRKIQAQSDSGVNSKSGRRGFARQPGYDYGRETWLISIIADDLLRHRSRPDAEYERYKANLRADGITLDEAKKQAAAFLDRERELAGKAGAVGSKESPAALSLDETLAGRTFDQILGAVEADRGVAEMLKAAATHGAGLGEKWGRRAQEAMDRARKNAVAEARGRDFDDLQRWHGIDVAATLLGIDPEKFGGRRVRKDEEERTDEEEGGAGVDGEEVSREELLSRLTPEQRAEVESAQTEAEGRLRLLMALFQGWRAQRESERRKAARRAEEEARRQEQKQEGRDGEAPSSADAEADALEDVPDFTLFTVPQELIELCKVDVNNAEEMAAFLRLAFCDWLVRTSGGELTMQTVFEGRPENVEKYRRTMQSALDSLSRKLLDPERGTLIRHVTKHIERIGRGLRPDVIEGRTAAILRIVQANAVRRSQNDLIAELDKDLEKLGVRGRKLDKMERDADRKIRGEREETVRWIRQIITWGPRKIAAETDKLMADMDLRRNAYGEAGAAQEDVFEDVVYHRAAERLAALQKYGGLRYRMPGEILSAGNELRQWLEYSREEHLGKWEAFQQENDRIAEALRAAVARPDRPALNREKAHQRFLRRWADESICTLSQRLDLLLAGATGDVRTAGENAKVEILKLVAFGSQQRAVLMKQYAREFEEAVGRACAGAQDEKGRPLTVKDMLEHLDEKVPDELSRRITRQRHFQTPGRDGRLTYGQALQILAYLEQTATYAENIELHERTGQAEALREALPASDIALLHELRTIYGQRREALSEAVMEVTGFPVWSPDPLYMPVRMYSEGRDGLDVRVQGSWNPLASSLTPRIRNGRDVNESLSIVDLYNQSAQATADAIAFGVRGIRLRSVLARGTVKQAVIDAEGKEAASALVAQLTDTLTGGERTGSGSAALGALRGFNTAATYAFLAWNPASMLKQMTSVPAWAPLLPRGMRDVLHYVTHFDAAAARELIEAPGFAARYGLEGLGLQRARAILTDPKLNWVQKYHQLGMIGLQIGDALPGILVGQGVYKAIWKDLVDGGRDPAAAREEAAARTWEMIEECQQSDLQQNLPEIMRRYGVFGRSVMKFATSPLMQASWEINAIRVWRRSGSAEDRRKAIDAVIANHVLMPAMIWIVQNLVGTALGQDPDDEDAWRLRDLAVLSVLGSFGRFYVIGPILENAVRKFAGMRTYTSDATPGLSWAKKTASDAFGAGAYLVDGDYDRAVDSLLRTVGDVSAPARMTIKAVKNYGE